MMYDVTLVSCILINQMVKKPRKFAKRASKYARLTDAVPPVNCLFGEERAPGSKVRWKIEPVIASKTAIALYKNLI